MGSSSSSELQASALPLLVQLLLYISYRLTTKKKKKPATHGLTAHPLLGHLPSFLENRHCFLDRSMDLIVASRT